MYLLLIEPFLPTNDVDLNDEHWIWHLFNIIIFTLTLELILWKAMMIILNGNKNNNFIDSKSTCYIFTREVIVTIWNDLNEWVSISICKAKAFKPNVNFSHSFIHSFKSPLWFYHPLWMDTASNTFWNKTKSIRKLINK